MRMRAHVTEVVDCYLWDSELWYEVVLVTPAGWTILETDRRLDLALARAVRRCNNGPITAVEAAGGYLGWTTGEGVQCIRVDPVTMDYA